MQIKSIHWLFGKPNYAAKLLITDGYHECFAFCYLAGVDAYQCACRIGYFLKEPLFGIIHDIEVIERSSSNYTFLSNKGLFIEQTKLYGLSYRGVGQLIDKSTRLMQLGNLLIYWDRIPAHSESGDYLAFQCSRFDVIELEYYAVVARSER